MKKILSTLFLTVGMIASGMQMAVASSEDGDLRDYSRRKGHKSLQAQVRDAESRGEFLSLARIAQIVNAVADTKIQLNFVVVLGTVTGTKFKVPDLTSVDTLTLVCKSRGNRGPGITIPLKAAIIKGGSEEFDATAAPLASTQPSSSIPMWVGTGIFPGRDHSSYTARVYASKAAEVSDLFVHGYHSGPVDTLGSLLLKTHFRVKPSPNRHGTTIVLGGELLETGGPSVVSPL